MAGRITKEMRLRRRAEFLAVQSDGRKLHGRHLLAIARKRSDPLLVGRLGITVTKKVGNAVVRNRIKRLIREWMRLHDLIKADDPSPFPALTQIEVWGRDLDA